MQNAGGKQHICLAVIAHKEGIWQMSALGGTKRERDHTCDIEGVEVGRGAVTLCMRVLVSICVSLKRLSTHIPLYLCDQQTAQDPTQGGSV